MLMLLNIKSYGNFLLIWQISWGKKRALRIDLYIYCLISLSSVVIVNQIIITENKGKSQKKKRNERKREKKGLVYIYNFLVVNASENT